MQRAEREGHQVSFCNSPEFPANKEVPGGRGWGVERQESPPTHVGRTQLRGFGVPAAPSAGHEKQSPPC